MPKVPTYSGPRVQQAPIPGVRRTAAPTAASLGAGVADQVTQIAHEFYQQQLARADTTALLAEEREAGDQIHAWLHDPERGAFHRVKGVEALGLRESTLRDFDSWAGKRLTSAPQRRRPAMEQLFARRRLALDREVGQYTGQQITEFEERESLAAIAGSQRDAIANATDDRRVREELDRQAIVSGILAENRGYGPEARAQLALETSTRTHVGVIDRRLTLGLHTEARRHYDTFREQIAGEQHAEIERRLEVATIAGEGLWAAEAIWQQHGPKTDGEAIQLDVMEADARRVFASDEPRYRATMNALKERANLLTASRRERTGADQAAVWGAVNEGASLRDVQRMEAYRNLPGDMQAQVTQQVLSQQETAANRAQARTRRADEAQERGHWAAYWQYSQPEVLSRLSEDEILALTPEVGVAHMNRLMEAKRQLATPRAVQAATIDEDVFKSLVRAMTPIDPYGTLNAEKRAQLGQLKVAVEGAIDLAQQAKGNRALTRTEKDAEVRKIVADTVRIAGWFKDSAPLPAAMVINPDDRRGAYVPIADIPEPAITDYLNIIRAQSPTTMQMSATDLQARFARRLERAYARRLLGGSRAEIEALLLGRALPE